MMDSMDAYFEELERKEKEREERQAEAAHRAHLYGGGWHAAKGDYEGACLARAEFEGGQIS